MFVLGTPFMMFAEIPWMDTRAVHTSAGRVGGDEEVELVAAGVAQQLALGPVRPPVAPAHRRPRPACHGRDEGQSSFLAGVQMNEIDSLAKIQETKLDVRIRPWSLAGSRRRRAGRRSGCRGCRRRRRCTSRCRTASAPRRGESTLAEGFKYSSVGSLVQTPKHFLPHDLCT